MLYPGVSTILNFVFCHGNPARAELIVNLRAASSSSKSVVVLPSSTFRCRSVAPAVNSIAEVKEVLPQWPCPIKATFRISELSKTLIIREPPEENVCFGRLHARDDRLAG
jgi:hypothetical protein